MIRTPTVEESVALDSPTGILSEEHYQFVDDSRRPRRVSEDTNVSKNFKSELAERKLALREAELAAKEAKLEQERRLAEARLDEDRANRRLAEAKLEQESRLAEARLDEDRATRRLAEAKLELERERIQDHNSLEVSLAVRTSRFQNAMKGIMAEFPSDPAAIPGYFQYLENQFASYQVDDDVKPKILQAHLNNRARSILSRLTVVQLGDYEELKQILLQEFRVTPSLLRERFYAVKRRPGETYSQVASELHTALSYYIKSRNIDENFHQLVSLMCADRLKQLMSPSCADFILTQEKDDWLNHLELSRVADSYMATHEHETRPPRFNNPKPTDKGSGSPIPNRMTKISIDPNMDKDKKYGLCFKCHKKGHSFKECPLHKFPSSNLPNPRINCCQTENSFNCLGDRKTFVDDKNLSSQSKNSRNCLDDRKTLVDGKNLSSHSENSFRGLVDRKILFDGQKSFPCPEACPIIDVDDYHIRSYENVFIDQLPSIPALIDGGAEVCCIREDLIKSLHRVPHKFIKLSGLKGQPEIVGCVRLVVRPDLVGDDIVNLAPKVRAWFAVVPNLNEQIIITPSVSNLLKTISLYDTVAYPIKNKQNAHDSDVNVPSLEITNSQYFVLDEPRNDEHSPDVALILGEGVSRAADARKVDSQTDTCQDIGASVVSGDDICPGADARKVDSQTDTCQDIGASVVSGDDICPGADARKVDSQTDTCQDIGVSVVAGDDICPGADAGGSDSRTDARFTTINDDCQGVDDSNDPDAFAKEQHDCPSLKSFWLLGIDKRKNFYIDRGLLFHKENQWGHSIKQLCLPRSRILAVLQMGHDAPYSGHMAAKSTRQRIRLSFWFPDMEKQVQTYCESCPVCQLRAPVRKRDRVPITPIPRGDELPFNHLVMDCIGPIIPAGDSVTIRPKYNYALVVVDLFSRWPMAYPLRSLDAKSVCEILIQIFMTFSIPRIISSDCGTNFKNQLTTTFLKCLGCSPRFNTPGHPEASGLVERCNQSLKNMIFKLVEAHPKEWFKVLPFVLWSLREKPSSTTHIAPYTLVYGTLPRGPLAILRDSWSNEKELPFHLGKNPYKYLADLRQNLQLAKEFAEIAGDQEQSNYARKYNVRSSDRSFCVGDRVIILAPVKGGSKFMKRWQGPGVIVKVKAPYSYLVEIEGCKHHLHANKIRKYHDRIETAINNNCSVVYEKDHEFGLIDFPSKFDPCQDKPPSCRVAKGCLDHLSQDYRTQLCDIIDDFPEIFSESLGVDRKSVV